jgi:hypothetical protein
MLTTKKTKTLRAEKDVKKTQTFTLLVEMSFMIVIVQNNVEVAQTVKVEALYDSAISLLGIHIQK